MSEISAYFSADEKDALVKTAAELVCGVDLEDLSERQVRLASIARALMDAEMEDGDSGHEREAATPQPDGSLLADCSCGGTYSVRQGGNEYVKLERARAEHVASVNA